MIVGTVGVDAAPAKAITWYSKICQGFGDCNNKGRGNAGYQNVYTQSFWAMYGGHNCTNYVAYRLQSNGVGQFTKPGQGNAYQWGAAARSAGIAVDKNNPSPGDVAWFDVATIGGVGHVAYVESVDAGAGTITVSEDNYGGDFDWRTYRISDVTGFIHVGRPPGSAQPFGTLDEVVSVHGGVHVRGWAIDPDTNDPIDVHIYVDGVYRTSARADNDRPDVDAVYHRGANHGYTVFLGTETVGRITVYAINAGGGNNPELGSASPPVSAIPKGSLDEVRGGPDGVNLRGWAMDPDTREPVAVHIYRNGAFLAAATANASRPDVDAVFGNGAEHGFDVRVPVGSASDSYAVYAINYGSGGNPQFGSSNAPANATTPPGLTGTSRLGGVLTASVGSWDAEGLTFGYQWQRAGVDIPGATSPRYVPTAADVAKRLRVVITATRPGLSTAVAPSAESSPVGAGQFTDAPTPRVSGTPTVGSTLTVIVGTWTPAPDSLQIQWLREGKAIAGATAKTYKLTTADAGAKISVSLTGRKAGYTPRAMTSASVAVPLMPFGMAPTPTIRGKATVGSTLTATAGAWKPAPDALRYQWFRGGVAISGATGKTYTVKKQDRGARITVRVTATKSGYASLSRTSAPISIPR